MGTPLRVKFAFNARSRVVRKEMEANKVDDAWKSSNWAKRLERKATRGGLNDFDRFKLRKAKSARNKIVAKALNTKKKQLRKAGKLKIVIVNVLYHCQQQEQLKI